MVVKLPKILQMMEDECPRYAQIGGHQVAGLDFHLEKASGTNHLIHISLEMWPVEGGQEGNRLLK